MRLRKPALKTAVNILKLKTARRIYMPADKANWFRLTSDAAQVVEPWQWPSPFVWKISWKCSAKSRKEIGVRIHEPTIGLGKRPRCIAYAICHDLILIRKTTAHILIRKTTAHAVAQSN